MLESWQPTVSASIAIIQQHGTEQIIPKIGTEYKYYDTPIFAILFLTHSDDNFENKFLST